MTILLILFAAMVVFLTLAIWQGTKAFHLGWSWVAGLLVAIAGLLAIYGLFFGESVVVRQRYAFERLLEPAVLPMFLLLPSLIAFCLVQWLRRRAYSAKYARVVAGVAGSVVCGVTPLGVIAAGCGLAGQCF